MQAPRAMALCFCFGGALEFGHGKWQDARRQLEQAIDLYRKVGSASGEALSLQRLAVLKTAEGDHEAGRELLIDGFVVAERAAMRSHCLTRMHASLLRNRLAAGDLEGARDSLGDGLAAAERHGHCVTCNALLGPELVRVQVALGDVDSAEQAARTLEQTADEFQSRAWTAMASHARARVARARGDLEPAAQAFARAAADYLEIEQPYEAARCLRAQGQVLEGLDAASAVLLLRQATQIFADLGAPGIED